MTLFFKFIFMPAAKMKTLPAARAFPFRGIGVYMINGKVTEDYDHYSVEVSSMYRLRMVEDVRYAEKSGERQKEEGKVLSKKVGVGIPTA